MKCPRNLLPAAILAAIMAASPPAASQERLADLLARPGANLNDPASRQRIVDRLKVANQQRRETARAKARQRGLPLRLTRPNGTTQELVDFDGDQPVYFTTDNSNAAISSGANLVRNTYGIQGSGVTVGIWDGGSVRSTHQEFGGRVVVKDGAGSLDHATHVGGTIAAAGVVSSARGMAPLATVDSYDWNNDITEMTARGATAPGQQATHIYLSNHSYGYVAGWNWVGTASQDWEWWGNGTTATGIDNDFGRYNTYARDQDALAFNAPYYLIFRSAGNERSDNPATGEKVSISSSGGTIVTYDPALHPAGDGQYRGGFECMAFDALAKNVITVGSTLDAVTGGLRDIAKASPSSFSAFGPTDDGRIKPDVVANGEAVYSSLNGSNTSYGNYSGTSMATPSATGSAALLIQHYGNLFPGGAMRASTLKGLLLHTADDRGNPGPDYKYGWGLVNVKAAADLLGDHSTHPEKHRVTEDQLTTGTTIRSQPFVWDGTTPIRATLCWTDPAGNATNTSDSRTSRLVNNLNLKLISPSGSEFFPWVMPFVGTWTQASMDSAATTGVNNTDNVEQVLIPSPGVAGTWQAVVSFSGALTNGSQNYSLLLNGAAAIEPPPPPLVISAVTPASAVTGTFTMDLAGTGFEAGTAVKLTRAGQPDIQATGEQLIGESLRCQVNLSGAAAGAWNVVAANPDLGTTMLPNGFTVISGHYAEYFEGTVTGWTSQATTGTNAWSLVSSASHSPVTSYFAPAPSTKTTTALTSPAIAIPADATNLQLSFWHSYSLQSARDGGKLEFSIDGGTWFEVTSAGSGLSFSNNGYNSTIGGNGPQSGRSEFEGSSAWSGNSGGFINTRVDFNDSARFAGTGLRLRWRLATDSSTSSTGWYLDTISLVSSSTPINQVPVITTAASSASAETVTDPDTTVFQILRGTGTTFTVAASDDGGEPALHYTWSSTGPAPVIFQGNGSNAAKSSIASFSMAGDYVVTLAVQDAQGLTTYSSVHIRVVQTESSISVSPATASVPVDGTQAFGATLRDQFAAAMASQPPSLTWSASGGGTINGSGLFSAMTAGGPHVITAASGSISNTASITVTPAPATITLGNLTPVYDGSPKEAGVTTSPPGLAVTVTYDGSSSPPVNAGSYAVQGVINNPNYQGSSSGTLVIGKASATITLGTLTATYDGTPKAATATTTPEGLNVSLAYDGSAEAPVNAGNYAVVATINDVNHEGSTTGTLVIGKAAATFTLGNLATTYDGSPKAASATTSPPDLTVFFTYDGSGTLPVNAGNYAFAATINDSNYQGSASDTLSIAKAIAAVALGHLDHDYDGAPKAVTATTDPPGLAVAFTYDGSTVVPSAVGTYEVVATVDDANHQGSAGGTLEIHAMIYAQWIKEEFGAAQLLSGEADPDDDTDHDGLDNLAEYALGTDPNSFTPAPAFVLDATHLTLTFTRPKGRDDVSYHAETGDLSGEWVEVPLEVTSETETHETVRAHVARPAGDAPLFLRLRFD